MTAEIARLPRRQFSYVVVREPDCYVLFKAYSDNVGTVRLCEFKSRQEVDEFLSELPPAGRVWL
jgi:hypothetical protein